jgi:hypothetical protein
MSRYADPLLESAYEQHLRFDRTWAKVYAQAISQTQPDHGGFDARRCREHSQAGWGHRGVQTGATKEEFA